MALFVCVSAKYERITMMMYSDVFLIISSYILIYFILVLCICVSSVLIVIKVVNGAHENSNMHIPSPS